MSIYLEKHLSSLISFPDSGDSVSVTVNQGDLRRAITQLREYRYAQVTCVYCGSTKDNPSDFIKDINKRDENEHTKQPP